MTPPRLIFSGIFSTVNAWRHPALDPRGIYTVDFYRRLAETAERGKLDMVFFGDALSLPGQGADGVLAEHAITRGLEPATVIGALAACVDHLGLAGTFNTSYWTPEAIARKTATLHLLSGGRMAWNVVTATIGKDDDNLRPLGPLTQQQRYERTDEAIGLIRRLWAGWPEHAAGPRLMDHRGRWFTQQRPLPLPDLLGGDLPLLVQAGRSPEFQLQAARTAEAVFTTVGTIEEGRAFHAAVKSAMPRFGRAPGDCKILPGLRVVLGRTQAEADDKAHWLESLVLPEVSIGALSASLGHDLSGCDPDGPLPPAAPGTQGSADEQAWRAQIRQLAADRGYSILQLSRAVGQGRGHAAFTGTPEGLAGMCAQWRDARACDGFNIMFPSLPEGLEDFVDLGIPALQERGLAQAAYRPGTLREKLKAAGPA